MMLTGQSVAHPVQTPVILHRPDGDFCVQILQQLQLPESSIMLTEDFIAQTAKPHLIVRAGQELGPRQLLFTKISDEEVEQHRTRFSGTISFSNGLLISMPPLPPPPSSKIGHLIVY